MPRCYTVNLTPAAIAVATTDLIVIAAADDIPIAVRAIRVFQISDFGDAQDEVVEVRLVRGNTSAGSGGATFTPLPIRDSHDAAASFTARVGDTTAASGGTATTVYSTGWNVRAPLELIFPEDMMRRTDQGAGFLALRIGAAPLDSLTMGAQLDVWEL